MVYNQEFPSRFVVFQTATRRISIRVEMIRGYFELMTEFRKVTKIENKDETLRKLSKRYQDEIAGFHSKIEASKKEFLNLFNLFNEK